MKRLNKIIVVLSLAFLMAGCAGIEEKWNALTPNEKARVILNGLQDQLNGLFDEGKAYVATNPSYQENWKQKIVPAFDTANKTIAAGLSLVAQGKATDVWVYQNVTPLVQSIEQLLLATLKGGKS